MKAPDNLQRIHDDVLKCAEQIIPKAQHQPMIFFDYEGEEPIALSLAGHFDTNDAKELTAMALKATCAEFKPGSAVFIAESIVGKADIPESESEIPRAADCPEHWDALLIQIEVPGAIHVWSHRLYGEFPNRTMEAAGTYFRHGPMDWGRFVVLPENQEVEPCQPN